MNRFVMTIDGESADSASRIEVINPATGRVYATAPDCSAEQLDKAMVSAERAWAGWKIDDAARRAVLHRAADLLAAAAEDIGLVLTAEQGKPLLNAVGEVRGAAAWFRYFADLTLPVEIIQEDAAARVEVVRRPLGVIAAITPWNVPILLAAWKLAPALAAGNTVVLKPSPFTPLSSLMMGEVLAAALPRGVLNVVSGGDALGRWMTAHAIPRKISFTGSVATGKAVATAAAADLKRVTLELGGNDPAILLDDIDVAASAEKLFWKSFANNGQICAAIKRLYVPERLYHDVVDALAAIANAVKLGNGVLPETQLGPINNLPQLDRVESLVTDAKAAGGRIAAGGRRLEGPGYFYRPTILYDVSDGTRIVDEEQFGPALPIIPYKNLDDAIARANRSHFGLGASVWGADTERAGNVASQLDCGTNWVNDHMTLGPHQPFGGSKWSGIGLENGRWGLLDVTQLQVRSRPQSN